MRCLCFSLLTKKRSIIDWDDIQFFWKCCLLFALTDVKTCNTETTTKQSLNMRNQSTQQSIKWWTYMNKKLSNQASTNLSSNPVNMSKQSRFSHPKTEPTAASSKHCNYVRCSSLWILSLAPFWLVYLSCFRSQVQLYVCVSMRVYINININIYKYIIYIYIYILFYLYTARFEPFHPST